MSAARRGAQPAYIVRKSAIHGHGVFARRAIRRGARVVEYLGERISLEEAEARQDHQDQDPGHVLLFSVDARTVIDAGRGGNAARFINHSCAPNCEAVLDDGRIYIEATRHIAAGEELTYDYHLSLEGAYTAEVRSRYRCRCGASSCRGTMLEPRPRGRGRKRTGGRAAKGGGRRKGA